MTPSPADNSTPFQDAAAVAGYAERTRRLVPGYDGLPTMAAVLLAERAGTDAQVLVVGAGGGAELAAFARLQPAWRLVGVDPSGPMLDLARQALGAAAGRALLHEGTVDSAPAGPFDGACCLLTLHFLPLDERRRTLQEIRRRLRPGARFVMAHISAPSAPEDRALWLSRYAGFAVASGLEPSQAQAAVAAISERLPLLAPDQEEALLADAGFTSVQLFYAGLAFRGWVATA